MWGYVSGVRHKLMHFSRCCGASADFIEMYDEMVAPLPDVLRKLAIEQERQERAEPAQAEDDLLNAQAELRARHIDTLPPHLRKTEENERAARSRVTDILRKEISSGTERPG